MIMKYQWNVRNVKGILQKCHELHECHQISRNVKVSTRLTPYIKNIITRDYAEVSSVKETKIIIERI